MATLTIRDLDDTLKLKLRVRAAGQNRSMEEEARQILRAALQEPSPPHGSFVARVRKRFEGLGDVQLDIEPRESIRHPLEIHESTAAYVPAPGTPRESGAVGKIRRSGARRPKV
jgi:plasmid stability protein